MVITLKIDYPENNTKGIKWAFNQERKLGVTFKIISDKGRTVTRNVMIVEITRAPSKAGEAYAITDLRTRLRKEGAIVIVNGKL